MITLTVVSHNGQPGDTGLSARFDELGGTVGRADTNQLVLPDPDRAISRVHAQIVFRNGSFAVVDRGSNPIAVNGQVVGNGREQLLKDGDQVQIGGYILSAQIGAAANGPAARDPFADLLGPATAPKESTAPAAGWDPLDRVTAPAPSPSKLAASRPGAAASSSSLAGGIPDNWDPFARDPAPAAGSPRANPLGFDLGLEVGAAAPAPLIPELAAKTATNDSLDDLFGLKNYDGGMDPLAHSRLDSVAANPNMSAHDDPMQSLRSLPKANEATRPDDMSDLHRPFQPPSSPPKTPAVVTVPPPVAERAAPVIPDSAVLSWDQPAGAEGRTVIRPAAAASTAEKVPVAEPAQETTMAFKPPTVVSLAPSVTVPEDLASPFAALAATSVTPPPAVEVALPPATIPAPVAAPATPSDQAALIAALREGLAMPSLPLDVLTPEFMKMLGELLRESASGTVDLLVARAALKREVRAEATMIVARENNPLKFSPSADVALQHLLVPPMRGFMPAVPAMRDAYDDLRAHQFGLVAGMRAALAGVLTRFNPAQLESRLTQRSTLANLLPGSRKARMWDIFIEHFAQISTEAEDDFHTLFGKAFLQAYDEHIAQLRRDAP